MSYCLDGSETLALPNQPTVTGFWRWAFSDLKQNNVRGVFSEWLVAQILGLEMSRCRESWDAYDLITPKGNTIEVKSAAYLQSWHDESSNPSKIIFRGLRGQSWNPKTGYSGTSTYNAEIYVFSLQICTDPAAWNALDINQWRFYCLKRSVLEVLGCESMSLKKVSALTSELTAVQLQQHFMEETLP